MEKTIKFGKIELPIQEKTNKYVPKNGGQFIDHGNILQTIALSIKNNLPLLLIGESGTGKTSAIRYLATQTNNGLRRVNLNGGTTADELVGRLLINEKGTYWIDGILTEAMRNGEWIVLDEINAALPEVLFILQSVLDDDAYLVLTEKDDKEIVYKHPDFRIFATCNPPEYAGTKEMNQALLSRFTVCINAEFPPKETELQIIENRLGNAMAKSEIAEKLIGLAQETRKAKENGSADYVINTRDVLNTLFLSQSMEPIDALSLAFGNKLDPADNQTVKRMARLHLPIKKTNITKTELKSTEEISIGKTYELDKDIADIYIYLTKEEKEFKQTTKTISFSDMITKKKTDGIKGEMFIITGTYYADGSEFPTTEQETTLGEKIASTIRIISGSQKDNHAIILHNKELNKSNKIIKQIHEIN